MSFVLAACFSALYRSLCGHHETPRNDHTFHTHASSLHPQRSVGCWESPVGHTFPVGNAQRRHWKQEISFSQQLHCRDCNSCYCVKEKNIKWRQATCPTLRNCINNVQFTASCVVQGDVGEQGHSKAYELNQPIPTACVR